MGKGRFEAFSDGVIAVIITIMVLELKAPHGTDLAALAPLVPVFLSYVLSFMYVGIYWNNHHHMLHAVQRINGRSMWANLHLLFWLSLIPFVTAWVNENHFASLPVALYGVVLLMSGDGVLHSRAHADRAPRRRLRAGAGDGQRLQGHRLGRHLRGGDRAGFPEPVDSLRVVRAGGRDVVHSRPADREHRRALTRAVRPAARYPPAASPSRP